MSCSQITRSFRVLMLFPKYTRFLPLNPFLDPTKVPTVDAFIHWHSDSFESYSLNAPAFHHALYEYKSWHLCSYTSPKRLYFIEYSCNIKYHVKSERERERGTLKRKKGRKYIAHPWKFISLFEMQYSHPQFWYCPFKLPADPIYASWVQFLTIRHAPCIND